MTSAQTIVLPDIPELYENNFLDILLPTTRNDLDRAAIPAPPAVTNPMIDALILTTHQTFTAKGAPAYNTTDSAILDAFNSLEQYTFGSDVAMYLAKSWKEDPGLTLRLIWTLRSIPDGKGSKEIFYRCVHVLLRQYLGLIYFSTERLVGCMIITPGLRSPTSISWLNPFVSLLRRASQPSHTALGKISSIYFALLHWMN